MSTWNNALSYSNPDNNNIFSGRLSLFFKSVRGLSVSDLHSYLESASKENLLDTIILIFNIRDCRGGKGERELGRQSLLWLMNNYPKEFQKVFKYIPEYGRWDDLLCFFPNVAETKNAETKNVELQTEVVKYMSETLKKDKENMLNGKSCTLCAKWTPSEKSSLDIKYNVYNTLANVMNISKKALRTHYNSPLRSYLNIVERYMCSKQWDKIDFNTVPSCAMKRLKKCFMKNTPTKFSEWIQNVYEKKENAKVNAKQLFPHEIISEVLETKNDTQLLNSQWKVISEETQRLGCLQNCVAVVDVSGSMYYTENPKPIHVSIALGLLISEFPGDYHNTVITFESEPSLVKIPEYTELEKRVLFLKNIKWGGSTDLVKTFKLLLDNSKQGMSLPKKLIIISDMQFDRTGGNKTNIDTIDEMFEKEEKTRPQLIFWNVNGSSNDFPCNTEHKNVTLLSGFSPVLLKAVIGQEEITVTTLMQNIINSERYDNIRNALI